MRFFRLLLFAGCIFLADFLLKSYVYHTLPPMGLMPIFPYGGIKVFENLGGVDFSIVHVINKGAAWGLLASFHELLFYGRILIIGALLVYLFFFGASAQRVPLFLIITGALGNVFDHILYGHVVDMFYFRLWGYSFPVFNVADSAIFCGIVLLLIQSVLEKREKARAT